MISINFGVCKCNLDAYEPKIEGLTKFDTYEKAFNYYLTLIDSYGIPKDIWIVFIENNKVVQFDRLATISKTKIVKM